MSFLSTTFPNAPAHPPLYLLTSPLQYESYCNEKYTKDTKGLHECSPIAHKWKHTSL